MILTTWIEEVREEDILNIREEFGEMYISIRRSSGAVVSWSYTEIMRVIDEWERSFEGRMNMAGYSLDYETASNDNDKKWKLLLEKSKCEIEVRKAKTFAYLFWQKVERFKAGLDWREPVLKSISENEDDVEKTAVSWGVQRYIELVKPKSARAIRKNRTIAKEAVDKFFSKLQGKDRERKIDSFRDRLYRRVKQEFKKPKTSPT